MQWQPHDLAFQHACGGEAPVTILEATIVNGYLLLRLAIYPKHTLSSPNRFMNADANNAKSSGNSVTFRVPVTHDGNKWHVLNYALPTMASDRQKKPGCPGF
ncbi:hypothetical protein [Candidatus Symbiopectobacterium sp. 'North America']|uniref:hypothetical protein n=1 Tax=Candidatus Symbiopectobacterium sp. 'North America' TaxID=2794574 RepID=UPI001FCFA462|nr:hypothetical protein [Candidatus Symbiopectobacterium sp. 'North America']